MSLRDHVRHTLKWTDAVRAVAIHPELRTQLTLRLFWKPTHLWLLAAPPPWPAAGHCWRPRPPCRTSPTTAGSMRVIHEPWPGPFRPHLAIDVCEIATASRAARATAR